MFHLHPFITIEGNIGAGKTSLSKLIAAEYNAHLILERFDENPFIAKFYEDKARYSLPLELTLMAERYAQMKEVNRYVNSLFTEPLISDYLFIKSKLYAAINLKDEEWWLYQKMFDLMHAHLPQPSLLLYLHLPIDKLLKQIALRGRSYEKKMDTDYLLQIENNYFELFKSLNDSKIIVLDATNLDFVNNTLHYQKIKNILSNTWQLGINYIEKETFEEY